MVQGMWCRLRRPGFMTNDEYIAEATLFWRRCLQHNCIQNTRLVLPIAPESGQSLAVKGNVERRTVQRHWLRLKRKDQSWARVVLSFRVPSASPAHAGPLNMIGTTCVLDFPSFGANSIVFDIITDHKHLLEGGADRQLHTNGPSQEELSRVGPRSF